MLNEISFKIDPTEAEKIRSTFCNTETVEKTEIFHVGRGKNSDLWMTVYYRGHRKMLEIGKLVDELRLKTK